jgi:hypothetical protein
MDDQTKSIPRAGGAAIGGSFRGGRVVGRGLERLGVDASAAAQPVAEQCIRPKREERADGLVPTAAEVASATDASSLATDQPVGYAYVVFPG